MSITLVVLFHAMGWLEVAGVSRDPLVLRVLQTTGGMRLPLFFLASGLFATRPLGAAGELAEVREREARTS